MQAVSQMARWTLRCAAPGIQELPQLADGQNRLDNNYFRLPGNYKQSNKRHACLARAHVREPSRAGIEVILEVPEF